MVKTIPEKNSNQNLPCKSESPKYPPLHLPKVGSFTRTTSFFNLPSLVQVVAFLPHWKKLRNVCSHWCWIFTCCSLSYYYSISRKGAIHCIVYVWVWITMIMKRVKESLAALMKLKLSCSDN
ncbi:hypothetical protein Bca4012_078531 [Brassica carinata]